MYQFRNKLYYYLIVYQLKAKHVVVAANLKINSGPAKKHFKDKQSC